MTIIEKTLNKIHQVTDVQEMKQRREAEKAEKNMKIAAEAFQAYAQAIVDGKERLVKEFGVPKEAINDFIINLMKDDISSEALLSYMIGLNAQGA